MEIAKNWKNALCDYSNPDKVKVLSSFFKTGKGQYGEGDIFIGLTVPLNRKIAEQYFDADFDTFENLLHDPTHEFRLSALLALVKKFKKSKDDIAQKKIIDFYLANTKYINNWDLVDLSCPYILGSYSLTHPHDLLYKLSLSDNLWEQRIAIVSTLTLIRHDIFKPTLDLCDTYLSHSHDLIHKASGWALREIGKHDLSTLRCYLDAHAHVMPRTMLRYAIEHLQPNERKHYLALRR